MNLLYNVHQLNPAHRGESTGKSSLLENITRCSIFPRDRDICTRCPVRLQLTNAGDEADDELVEVCAPQTLLLCVGLTPRTKHIALLPSGVDLQPHMTKR